MDQQSRMVKISRISLFLDDEEMITYAALRTPGISPNPLSLPQINTKNSNDIRFYTINTSRK